MTVIEPGSLVTLTDGIQGIVLNVQIGVGHAVQYQCAWWNDGHRNTDWFLQSEVQLQSGSEIQMGFCK